jgi:hypothetical protein
MGENARYRGQLIKIGTCEDMYYLRADQRHLISGYTFGALDRFRFPFPDEDTIEPGEFADHDRGWRIPETWSLPTDYTGHGSVQFVARAGYVLSIPCPEQFGQPGMHVDLSSGSKPIPLRVHRNGFNGHPGIYQQRQVEDQLMTVIGCGACGSRWRLELPAAEQVAQAFFDEADRQTLGDTERAHLLSIAERILAGYLVTA